MNKHLPAKSNGRMRGVTHHLSHRTRYRLASQHRNAETVDRVHTSVMRVPGVKKVEFNKRTGSLLVHHDETPEILSALDSVLDCIADDLFEELAPEGMAIVPGLSLIAHLIRTRFTRVNQYLSRMTDNYIDLKMLVPILFLGAGLYQASKNKAWFSQMPAWVLLYYAYDSYLKFHGPGIDFDNAPVPGNGHKYS